MTTIKDIHDHEASHYQGQQISQGAFRSLMIWCQTLELRLEHAERALACWDKERRAEYWAQYPQSFVSSLESKADEMALPERGGAVKE